MQGEAARSPSENSSPDRSSRPVQPAVSRRLIKSLVRKQLQEIRQEQAQKKEERARQPQREHAAPSRSRKKKKQKGR